MTVANYSELLSRRLDEILSSSQEGMLYSAIARIYLRGLLELTSPQEWERQTDAVWLRGREPIVLHSFRVGICSVVTARRSGTDVLGFRWEELSTISETLLTKAEEAGLAEEGHEEVSATAKIVTNYFSGNSSARDTLRLLFPNTGALYDRENSGVEDMSPFLPYDDPHEEVFDLQNDMRFHLPDDLLRQELFSPENNSEFTSKPHYVINYF